MKRQLGLSLVVAAILCVPPVWAQTGSDQSQSGSADQSQSSSSSQSQSGSTSQSQGSSTSLYQSGSTDQSQNGSTDQSPSSTGPQVAYTHPEQLPPLTLLNEVTANTGIKISLSTGLLTDYGTYGGSSRGYWQYLGSVGGGLHITQIRPTLMWDLRYTGGLSLSAVSTANTSTYTSMNQNAGATVLWQFSPRWQLAVQDSYIYTNDPFEPYLTVDRAPTFNDPNPIIYIPLSITEANVGSVSLTYVLGAHDSINFTGGESFQRFFNTTLAAQNSYSYSGGANYQHVFSPRLSAGVGYSFTALNFGSGISRSGIQAVTPFASYQLTPHMLITGFAGPEYTASKDIVPQFCVPGLGCFGYHDTYPTQWNVAEGATFAWSGTRNGFHAGFRHQISNGGGLLGAVTLYQATAAFRRSLNQRWNFSAGVSYNDSLSISSFAANRFSNTLQGIVNLNRNISQALTVSVYYAAIHSRQNYYSTQATSQGTNGVGILLHYAWGHSLGR